MNSGDYLLKRGLHSLELIDFIKSNMNELLQLIVQHVELVGASVGLAILTGVPFGIYIAQKEVLANLVLAVAGMIMTIPSIALFGVMIPLFSIFHQGIGFVPALAALVLYSQLPIIRNTYIAIRGIDANIRDAAIGMGMTTWERLSKVEIPIAMPVIMAGVRTAVVLTIGIGAIAAYIGAGGLGVYISMGISSSNSTLIQAGALAVSVLSIAADLILGQIQKRISPKHQQSS